jgi:hypothetical protein
VAHSTDLDVTAQDVIELASADAITAFLAKLGYDTSDRSWGCMVFLSALILSPLS